ncbi:Surface polysaccharide O-acyltransferase, integral membrane enzyme [Eubacterium ruminantium]|nr:Surface polysaccharide O-acyltransferase, integral membrane enzyme [Eubacterium ruminantium]
MKTRYLKYDIIRITAILMVVLLHCAAYIVIFYPDTSKAEFIIGNIMNGIPRAGTPMFLMLSGALLLDESRSFDVKKFYKKSFLAIVALLAFWLLLYAHWRALILPVLQGGQTDKKLFYNYLLKLEGLYPHLWYLFMLIGAYAVIPVLRLFVKRENKAYILGMIIFSVVVQFGVTTAGILTRKADFTISDFVTKFHVEYATGYIPYLLIGWYLTAFPLKKKAQVILEILGFAAVLWIILNVQFAIDSVDDIRDYLVEMPTLPAMLYGVGLFVFISNLAGDKTTKSRVVNTLSKASFGIYIIHVIFLDIFSNLIMPYDKFDAGNPFFYILLLFGLTFGVSAAVVLLFSKIPGLRRIIYYH